MHAWTIHRKCELSPRVALAIIITSMVILMASVMGTLACILKWCL